MHTGYSEVIKAIEAGVFALSLILLALMQSSLNPVDQPSSVSSYQHADASLRQ
jgi:hypothetical protein